MLCIHVHYKVTATWLPAKLTSSVATVRKERLARNPLSIGDQELDDRRDILDVGKAAVETVGFVEGYCLGGFLGVEERYLR